MTNVFKIKQIKVTYVVFTLTLQEIMYKVVVLIWRLLITVTNFRII